MNAAAFANRPSKKLATKGDSVRISDVQLYVTDIRNREKPTLAVDFVQR